MKMMNTDKNKTRNTQGHVLTRKLAIEFIFISYRWSVKLVEHHRFILDYHVLAAPNGCNT